MKFTTKDLQVKLLNSLNNDSIAQRNSVARLGAVMIATKQLELNNSHILSTDPLTLIEDAQEA